MIQGLLDGSSWEGSWSHPCIGVIMDRLISIGVSPVFREALYSSWRGWARLLLHCFRGIAGNSSGPSEEFWEIVFIASMMSSLVILMSDRQCICLWVCGLRVTKPLLGG